MILPIFQDGNAGAVKDGLEWGGARVRPVRNPLDESRQEYSLNLRIKHTHRALMK